MTDISESGIEAIKAVIDAARDLLDISGRSRNVSAERTELQQALHDLELCEDPAIEALIPTKPEAKEPEFDATDLDMIRRGDMLGPKLGAKVFAALQSKKPE